MTARIDREKFLSILTLVDAGLSSRDVVEQASCFAFTKGRVWTFNDEVACSHAIPFKLRGAIQAEPLKAILGKLKEADLEIIDSDKELVLKGKGGRRTGLIKQNEILLPIKDLEVPDKWKSIPDNFGDAVEFVQDCVCRDEASFPLTCVHIHPEYMEAFDNDQFARHKLEKGFRRQHLVRQQSLKSIVSLSMTKMAEGKEWLHFRNDEDLMLSCRRYNDEYLDLSKIAAAGGHEVVLPTGLIDASDKAEIFTTDNDKRSQLRIDLKPGHVELKGEGVYGWYREGKKIPYKGEAFTFMIQPQMLIRLLKKQTRCQINDKILRVDFGDDKDGVYITSLEAVKGK